MKKTFKKGDAKVKDHNHITGKYPESGLQDYNLSLTLAKKLYIVFHSLQNYYAHREKIEKYKFKINVILKTIDKYMSFTIKYSKNILFILLH